MRNSRVPITPKWRCRAFSCQTAAVEFQKAGPRHGWEKCSGIRKACFRGRWDRGSWRNAGRWLCLDPAAAAVPNVPRRNQRGALEEALTVATAMMGAAGERRGCCSTCNSQSPVRLERNRSLDLQATCVGRRGPDAETETRVST